MNNTPIGVYVHVPFCARLCPYCDFAVAVRRTIPHREYADAVLAELEARRTALENREVVSIYFGGGTPSLWDPAELERILVALDPHADVEVTLEANPLDLTADRVDTYLSLGVNRISVGLQSFDADVLRTLGRQHDPDTARSAISRVGERFTNWSVDLIVAVQAQTMAAVEASVHAVVDSGAPHLSVYELTIEPNTVFGQRLAKGKLTPVPEEGAVNMLDRTAEILETAGIAQYEVSSYARPGFESRHNQLYWTGVEYLGLGMGAHSMLQVEGSVCRTANPRKLKDYLRRPEPQSVEAVSADDHLRERLFLGVRTRAGVDVPADFVALFDEFVALGLCEHEGHHYWPTRRGFRMADAMAERIFSR